MILSSANIRRIALDLGADEVGFARVDNVHSERALKEWLALGYHGEMLYMERHLKLRLDPGQLLSGAKSIIAIAVNYYPTSDNNPGIGSSYLVAKYAWGFDYHIVLRKILEELRGALKEICNPLKGRICVDTAPFMDKYWAQMAGIGWQGKHTNLVSRHFGSWLLLGSLIIDHDLASYDAPHEDFCGKCTACIEACPTGAIIKPHQLDSRRCISYWTIESKQDQFPEFIRRNLNRSVFGCDLCINACPFNRFQKPHRLAEFDRTDMISILEHGNAAEYSQAEFDRLFKESPISRPGYSGILRNIRLAGRK